MRRASQLPGCSSPENALEPGERDYFARSIVNRLWHRHFGQGLVMPLDQMHAENPPSHPELLAWLSRDLVDHGYDLRRLIRGLVLSRAYARTSRGGSAESPDRPALSRVGSVRLLTSPQLGGLDGSRAPTPPACPMTRGPRSTAESSK